MNKQESERISKYIQTFGCWDCEGNSFDLYVTRDIISIKSSTQDFSFLINLALQVEFKKCQGLYTGIVLDGIIYKANHKDLLKFKQILSARVTFLSIHNEYYITKIIGQGGQAEGVYEAYQSESEEARAIKKYDKSKLSVKAIHKEIQITQKFSYKNVVKIFEVYESSSSIYIVYERLQVFHSDKYTSQQKQTFIYDLLNVLQLMHSRGYMHRDIKMSNIMIDFDNEIKLVDFGLATKCKKQHKQCGTPGYMAPEIFTATQYNEKCDIYSLGITIYEMLTNEQLFVGLNKNVIKHKNQIRLFNTDNLTKLPSEFQELTKSMLVSDPNLRISARIAKNWISKKDFDNSVLTDVTMNNSQKLEYK